MSIESEEFRDLMRMYRNEHFLAGANMVLGGIVEYIDQKIKEARMDERERIADLIGYGAQSMLEQGRVDGYYVKQDIESWVRALPEEVE